VSCSSELDFAAGWSFWVPLAATVVALIFVVMSLVDPQWIESLFGEPDEGSEAGGGSPRCGGPRFLSPAGVAMHPSRRCPERSRWPAGKRSSSGAGLAWRGRTATRGSDDDGPVPNGSRHAREETVHERTGRRRRRLDDDLLSPGAGSRYPQDPARAKDGRAGDPS
jgi:hypothetical protein